jgi:hypothetical protein
VTTPLTKPKHVYVLVGIAMLFMFTIGAFFEEGVAFFDPVYTTIMSDLEYYLSLIAVLAISDLLSFLGSSLLHDQNQLGFSLHCFDAGGVQRGWRFDLSLRLFDYWDKREG